MGVTGGTTAVETVEQTSQEKPEIEAQENVQSAANLTSGDVSSSNGLGMVEPDLDFIHTLCKQGGASLKQCFQCGTCSGTCAISPDLDAFPCKEMAWASWGMKERLLKDPDVWLCYQCNDCSTRCPRGAKPGDVLGAVRQECITHYAVPSFIGKWVSQPQCIPLLLGIPAALLSLAMVMKDPIENLFGITRSMEGQIVFAYSSAFPHWMLNCFFFFFCALSLIALVSGVKRYWNAMKEEAEMRGYKASKDGIWPSVVTALKTVVKHDKFSTCTSTKLRFYAHLCVFFGFIALCMVTFWVITAKINPFVHGDFAYPFSFFSPWKMLANAGGLAVMAGCLLMAFDHFIRSEMAGAGSYFDWALIATLFLVVLTGFITEALHYVRLDPHRHIAYFVHLVFVFALLVYLPYSKLAHIVYRTTALVFADYMGRDKGTNGNPGKVAAGKEVSHGG